MTLRSCARMVEAIRSAAASTPPLTDGGEQTERLITRILGARHPAALAEVTEGRTVFARGGEAEFGPWLAHPLPVAEVGEDMLVELRSMLGLVLGQAKVAGPTRFASLIEKANQLVGRIEQLERARPKLPTPDAVLERLRSLDAEAIAKIEEILPPGAGDKIDPKEVHG